MFVFWSRRRIMLSQRCQNVAFPTSLLRPNTNVVTTLCFRRGLFDLVLTLQQRRVSEVVFWRKSWKYSWKSVDLVTFTEEIFNGKPHFLCRYNTKHSKYSLALYLHAKIWRCSSIIIIVFFQSYGHCLEILFFDKQNLFCMY